MYYIGVDLGTSAVKLLLMESSGMTEERAHRYIQRRSMDCGARMADTAKLILLSLE